MKSPPYKYRFPSKFINYYYLFLDIIITFFLILPSRLRLKLFALFKSNIFNAYALILNLKLYVNGRYCVKFSKTKKISENTFKNQNSVGFSSFLTSIKRNASNEIQHFVYRILQKISQLIDCFQFFF